MADKVTYKVPDEHGEEKVTQESSIVPRVGEQIWVDVEHSEVYNFVVTDVKYMINPNPGDEEETQAVVELTPADQ